MLPNASIGTKLLLQQLLTSDKPCRTIGNVSDAASGAVETFRTTMTCLLDTWDIAKDESTEPSERCRECGNRDQVFATTWHGAHQQRGAGISDLREEAALIMPSAVQAGRVVLALRSHQKPAAWSSSTLNPLGQPITNSILEDNISWSESRCAACRRWLLVATSTCPLQAGDLLRGPTGPGAIRHQHNPAPEYVVSFDGGARHRSPLNTLPSDGPRAAGAGAALWGPPDPRGVRRCIAQATAAIPSLEDSLSAEAAGLRLGIALASTLLPRRQHLGIVGDNLPVIRLGAGNGRIRTPGIWELVEAALLHIADRDQPCQWTAVRRHYNKTADALATIGTQRAVDGAANNHWAPNITIWTNRDSQPNALPWHENWAVRLEQQPLTNVGIPADLQH